MRYNKDYQILINEIYKSNFGLNIDEYKKLKGINEYNILTDSMTNIELALINLAEVIIKKIHNINDSYRIEELQKDIREVGNIINITKKNIEEKLGKSIPNSENYMNITNYKE